MGLPEGIFTDSDCNVLKVFVGFEELLSSIEKSNSFEISLNEIELECKVSGFVRKFYGEAQVFALYALEHPEFVASLALVLHILDRKMIAELLKCEVGIKIFAENVELLHKLRTFEDFTSEQMSVLSNSFDVERLGMGLNTFPLPLLMDQLNRINFELNDPAAFLSRLDGETWERAEVQLLLSNCLNIATMTEWYKRVSFTETKAYPSVKVNCCKGTHYMTVLKIILLWHVRQQVRILD